MALPIESKATDFPTQHTQLVAQDQQPGLSVILAKMDGQILNSEAAPIHVLRRRRS